MFLVRFGGDLLSHVLRRSTIGATALNGRVRDGIGCFARAMTTKPKKRQAAVQRTAVQSRTLSGTPRGSIIAANISVVPSLVYLSCVLLLTCLAVARRSEQALAVNPCGFQRCLAVSGSNQAYRAISTSQLNALLHLHLWPIDVVVFHGSQGRPCFEGGFPLRCLQRLSCPNIATQHYRWHDNWSTSGSFTPVLSY